MNRRLAIVLAVAALWMLAVAGRLAALTVVEHDRYRGGPVLRLVDARPA